jgi:hypothetical protein
VGEGVPTTASLTDRIRRLSPTAILAAGWLGMILYANPGYLSYDSVHTLVDVRAGRYRDLAGVIWRAADHVIPGPFGMLVVQTTCFLAGAYLVLRRCMSPRSAAACATAALWFPAISGVLGVIWTEPHAVGWLVLGAGGLGARRRGARIAGLGALALGAAMLPGGALIALPLVLGLLATHPAASPGRRLAVAAAAWLAVAAIAVVVAAKFPAPPAAAPAQAGATGAPDLGGLGERWDGFLRRIQLVDRPAGSQVYVWFTDVQDLSGSAGLIRHNAAPSGLQRVLQPAMRWLGTTWLFVPYVYLALALALLPLCRRERVAGALLGSGVAGAVALLVAGHDPQFRAALWLPVAAVLGVAALIAGRAARARRV